MRQVDVAKVARLTAGDLLACLKASDTEKHHDGRPGGAEPARSVR